MGEMRVRIKYAKQGLMKYIGHLDMMRAFQKQLRRSAVDVVFTEGFSPHMSMSYAFPLGVGMTSDSAYVDVDLNLSGSGRELTARLNETSPEGVHFLDARSIPLGKANKGMALVAAADYTLTLRELDSAPSDWKGRLKEWLSGEQILVKKKTKKSEREINIRPLIYKAEIDPAPRIIQGIADDAPAAERRGDLYLQLSAGSEDNLRPDLCMEAFFRDQGWDYHAGIFLLNRDEVYAQKMEEGGGRFVPLIALGEEIL